MTAFVPVAHARPAHRKPGTHRPAPKRDAAAAPPEAPLGFSVDPPAVGVDTNAATPEQDVPTIHDRRRRATPSPTRAPNSP